MEKRNSKENKQKGTQIEVKDHGFDIIHDRSFTPEVSKVPISITKQISDYVDPKVINQRFYNKFNFSKLSEEYHKPNISLGVTSTDKGAGKTLVASNMAVSLVKAYQQRTVLVDLNFRKPTLHSVFGAPQKPGLAEALKKRIIQLNSTAIDDLYLLSAGDCSKYSLDIKDTIALREILFTLKYNFDFVIVDMSSVFPVENFPIHFINELDGLLAVIDTQNTRKEDLKKVFKHIDKERFVGYIFNKIQD
jgi:non-specific protein-tyrosine kinase